MDGFIFTIGEFIGDLSGKPCDELNDERTGELKAAGDPIEPIDDECLSGEIIGALKYAFIRLFR